MCVTTVSAQFLDKEDNNPLPEKSMYWNCAGGVLFIHY